MNREGQSNSGAVQANKKGAFQRLFKVTIEY